MKIISLNCQIKNADFSKIANFLDKQNADIVVLQEVELTDGDFSEKINSAMKTPYQFSKTETVEEYTTSRGEFYIQGQSVLSKFDFSSSKVNLSNVLGDKHNRISQNIEFSVGGEKITLSNVHFANKDGNIAQLEEIISRKSDIIVGDFNIRGEDVLKNKKEYSAACEFSDYASHPASDVFFQIDHCLISNRFNFRKVEVFEGLSDHNALILEIEEKR